MILYLFTINCRGDCNKKRMHVKRVEIHHKMFELNKNLSMRPQVEIFFVDCLSL